MVAALFGTLLLWTVKAAAGEVGDDVPESLAAAAAAMTADDECQAEGGCGLNAVQRKVELQNRTEMCGDMEIYSMYQGCCGGQVYLNRLEGCCGDQVFKSKEQGCCGDKYILYDPLTQNCCDDPMK